MSKKGLTQRQQGAAMVIVLLMSSLLLVMISTGLMMARNANKDTTGVFRTEGQVGNVAQAGLQDAVSWFKRHQPVKQDVCKDAAFNPVFNSDPAQSDTDNASIGLVKDMQIKGNLYGRYTIKKQPCPGTYDPTAVHDITIAKGKSTICPGASCTNLDGTPKGEGAVWYLESQGELYLRNDFSKDSNGVFVKGPADAPNRFLRKGSASVEISQLTVNVGMTPLTLFGTGANTSNFGGTCFIYGNPNASDGVQYSGLDPNTGSVDFQLPGGANEERFISPAVTTERVFSVSNTELRGMADNVYTNVSQLPERLKFSITYLDGNFSFDTVKPLAGGGLLYVNGDLTLENGSNSLFSGVIFVSGRLTIGRDNHLAGAVIARNVTCGTSSGGKSNIEFNSSLVTTVRQKLALYRENNLTHSFREY